jgi:parallel beta-helix repeat protein
MKWNTRGEKTHIVLAVVVCIAMLTMTGGATASSPARGTTALVLPFAMHQTIVVHPNGVNDTTDIQTAFNTCVSYGPDCTVQLVKGTYYTAQITVGGFQGNFVGAGQGRTIIQALPNLPGPIGTPFWATIPGPSSPWPVLFTFVGGTMSISRMTIVEPYANPAGLWTEPYQSGYAYGNYTALYSAVLITGQSASAYVDHVSVIGASGDADGFNMLTGVFYAGLLLPVGWTNPYVDRILLTGTFVATRSAFESELHALEIANLASSSAVVCSNTAWNVSITVITTDLSNSDILVCKNHGVGTLGLAAVVAEQTVSHTNLLPSTLYLIDNTFVGSGGANALAFEDLGPTYSPPVASTLSVVAVGNVLELNTSCGCYLAGSPYYAVVFSAFLESLVISSNKITSGGVEPGVYDCCGPATVSANKIVSNYVGVWVDYANGSTVTGNWIKNSAAWGIAVTDGSSSNTIAYNVVKGSGLDDLYWDGMGTGNLWVWNFCKTSSPPGLCR